MIFIPLVHVVGTVKHHLPVLGPVSRNGIIPFVHTKPYRVPRAVRLKICLIYDIQPVFVTQSVESGLIRIMTRPDGIDIVLLHVHKIGHYHLPVNDTAVFASELMSVDTAKYDPLAVKAHDMIGSYLKFPEPDTLLHHFVKLTGRGIYLYGQIIQVGLFGAPQIRRFYIEYKSCIRIKTLPGIYDASDTVGQHDAHAPAFC